MTNNQFFCDHKWEHFCSAEDQYMHCTNCGLRNPIGLFQHWDSGRDGPAVKWPPRDSGGKLPPGLTPIRNTTGRDIKITPKKNFLDHLIDAFKAPFKPRRRPIVKIRRVWRGPNPITGRTFSTWYWQCALCDHNMNLRDIGSTHYGELCFTWTDAYRRADRHAHNHHRSGK